MLKQKHGKALKKGP